MISKLIQDFSQEFVNEINNPYKATKNTQIVTKDLPQMLRLVFSLSDEYKTYGSVGAGNWSEIPWIAILDKSISTSTRQGYYIVLLFDKEIKNVYLALGLGWTQFESEYGTKEGRVRIVETGKYYARQLETKPEGFKEGEIDLKANNVLGKGYELGSIISKKYSISDLTDESLILDIKSLLNTYDELKSIVGNSILNLEIDPAKYDETVKTFKKKVAQSSFSEHTLKSLSELIEVANEAPPKVSVRLKKEITRNKKFADYVKQRANYICEVCGKEPFFKPNGQPYAEADHVIQLGGKQRGLDSPDNMRCLCAQCHRVLTYGSQEEIERLFELKR
jgi:5-methylcytosine-specific restriction protein A